MLQPQSSHLKIMKIVTNVTIYILLKFDICKKQEK
jgi:hypothetical protein